VLIEKVRTNVTDEQAVPVCRSATGHLPRDVHADRLQHGRAGRGGAAGELHGDGQRGPEGGSLQETVTCPVRRRWSTCSRRRRRRC